MNVIKTEFYRIAIETRSRNNEIMIVYYASNLFLVHIILYLSIYIPSEYPRSLSVALDRNCSDGLYTRDGIGIHILYENTCKTHLYVTAITNQ